MIPCRQQPLMTGIFRIEAYKSKAEEFPNVFQVFSFRFSDGTVFVP